MKRFINKSLVFLISIFSIIGSQSALASRESNIEKLKDGNKHKIYFHSGSSKISMSILFNGYTWELTNWWVSDTNAVAKILQRTNSKNVKQYPHMNWLTVISSGFFEDVLIELSDCEGYDYLNPFIKELIADELVLDVE